MILLLLAANVKAGPIKVRIPDTTMMVFDTIDIPVYADSSFTGNNVVAYQFDLTFTDTRAEILDVISTGTLSEGFGTITFGVPTLGRLVIAAAGTTPLSGSGKLIYIRVRAINSGYNNMNFASGGDNYFNEGDPEMITDNGYINITPKPTFNVYPSNVILTTGEQQLFTISGGTSPYTWEVMVDSVADINNTGLLTAQKRGKTKLIITDNNGIIDTTNFDVEVRAVELEIHDTASYQLNPIKIPIYINDITGLGINSGNVDLTFSEAYYDVTGIDVAGTLLEASNVEFSDRTLGECGIAFASDTHLSGEGILCYVIFYMREVTGNRYIDFGDVIFNEDILANTDQGYVNIQSLPDLNIQPSTTDVEVGETQQFTVSNGNPPLVWSSSNPSIASIDPAGLLTAHRSGTIQVHVLDEIGAEGTTGDITINGLDAIIPDTTISIDYAECGFEIPVRIGFFSDKDSILSVEMEIIYDTFRLIFDGINKAGKLLENWTVITNVTENRIVIAGAGIEKIKNSGELFTMSFSYREGIVVGNDAYLEFSELLFNEGIPFARIPVSNIEIGSPVDKDLGVTAISGPVNECVPGSVSDIEVTIQNMGSGTFLSCWPIYVGYFVDNGTEVRDTIYLVSDLTPGANINHTFSEDFDFSAVGTYVLKAYSSDAGDQDHTNDTTILNVHTYDYPNVDLGADIRTSAFPVNINAGGGMDAYLWNDASTNQILSAAAAGTYWVEVTLHGCSSSDTIDVIYDPTGISDLFADELKIYPVPAYDYLNIEIKGKTDHPLHIKITDVTGKTTISDKINVPFADTERINISALQPGTYIILFQSGDQVAQRKITVVRK